MTIAFRSRLRLLDFSVTNDTDTYNFVVQQVVNPITCDGALGPPINWRWPVAPARPLPAAP